MSVRRFDKDTPGHFKVELYDDDDDDALLSDDDSSGDEDKYNPALFRMPPGIHPPGPSENRDRSRSPLREENLDWPDSTPDEKGIPHEAANITENAAAENVTEEIVAEVDVFFAPDAHALYTYDRDADDNGSAGVTNAKRVRDRGRGRVREKRGVHGEREARRARFSSRPEVGSPLTEVWLNDEDVPSELKELVENVMNRREVKAKQSKKIMEKNLKEMNQDRCNNSENGGNEFEDAIVGKGESLLDDKDLIFQWCPMETFQYNEERFIPVERCGSVECYMTPYDAFRTFWDDEVLQHIVDQTNRFALTVSSQAFQRDWHPTTIHEILCLFAFWIMLGIIRMPTIKSCFSMEPALKSDIFRRLFNYSRYTALERALDFANPDPATTSSDRLYHIRPIISHLNTKFQSKYVLSKDICIGESLTQWLGKLDIKKYDPSQAAKAGVSTFELYESATGYVWAFVVDTGAESRRGVQKIKSTDIVVKLIEPLLNKGHRLFMNNQYNCPLLARFLKRNGTDFVGTLKPSRQDVPVLLTHAPLKLGEYIARHSGDVCILSWQGSERITMISTCHGSSSGLARVPSQHSGPPVAFKPQMYLDYRRSMGGIDLKDQTLDPYLLERKRCSKWYKKLFKHLVNHSILNARILLECSRLCRLDQLSFRLHLVELIMEHHLVQCAPRATRSVSRVHRPPAPILAHSHWPVRIPQRDADRAKNRQSRSQCAVCHRTKRILKRTGYKCQACNVPLCVENCFKEFHTGVR